MRIIQRATAFGTTAASLLIGGLVCLSNVAFGADAVPMLTGAQEVPPVTTTARGVNKLAVGTDRSVTGSVETMGLESSMAHIHLGAAGTNGPVVVTLIKTGPSTWSVPGDTRLTEAQYASYRHGDLYVNVHSALHPAGEMRLQLAP